MHCTAAKFEVVVEAIGPEQVALFKDHLVGVADTAARLIALLTVALNRASPAGFVSPSDRKSLHFESNYSDGSLLSGVSVDRQKKVVH